MKTKRNIKKMKSLSVLIVCLALSYSAFAGTPIGDFKMLKNRDGIDLYYRWMKMPEGKQVRQMKAVLEINGGTENILNLLKDEKLALEWIPSAEQFRNLTQVNGPEWVSYIQFAIPWPFADQDCILEYKTMVKASGETVIDFHTNPEYIGEVDGMSRMKDITGSFVIRELPDGRSILECYFLSEKASVIPRWITEPIITGSILSLMEALRDELTQV
jgi:hypothetical protein